MTQPRKQSEGDRERPFLATVIGVIAGSQIGFGIAFVWWQVIGEVIFGLGLHYRIRNQRAHVGSILLAFAGSATLGVAAGSFGVWLRN
jgi:hypothetical protein